MDQKALKEWEEKIEEILNAVDPRLFMHNENKIKFFYKVLPNRKDCVLITLNGHEIATIDFDPSSGLEFESLQNMFKEERGSMAMSSGHKENVISFVFKIKL